MRDARGRVGQPLERAERAAHLHQAEQGGEQQAERHHRHHQHLDRAHRLERVLLGLAGDDRPGVRTVLAAQEHLAQAAQVGFVARAPGEVRVRVAGQLAADRLEHRVGQHARAVEHDAAGPEHAQVGRIGHVLVRAPQVGGLQLERDAHWLRRRWIGHGDEPGARLAVAEAQYRERGVPRGEARRQVRKLARVRQARRVAEQLARSAVLEGDDGAEIVRQTLMALRLRAPGVGGDRAGDRLGGAEPVDERCRVVCRRIAQQPDALAHQGIVDAAV